jgi:methionyl-tRNA formyltransferase
MKIFITTMDEPLYTNPFLKEVIKQKHKDVVGLAVSKGNPISTRRRRHYFEHIIAMCMIMGLSHTLGHFLKTIGFRLKKITSRFIPFIRSPSITAYASELGIPVYSVRSVNSKGFLNVLRIAQPDIIVNQAQEILKRSFLEIPKIACLNRHNSLLPKNRGRLSPFWVILKHEEQTGVSIHFVSPDIDAGAIIVQKVVNIDMYDTFISLTRKCYRLAPGAMLEAIDMLAKGGYEAIPNDPEKGSYNSLPRLKDALRYRAALRARRKGVHT